MASRVEQTKEERPTDAKQEANTPEKWLKVIAILVILEIIVVSTVFILQPSIKNIHPLAPPSVSYQSMMNLVTWTNQNGYSSLQWGAITELDIFHVVPYPNGSLEYDGDLSNLASIINTAHSKGIKVALSIGGAGVNPAVINDILANATLRSTIINNLVTMVQSQGYDGVQIDFEGTYNQSEFTTFVQQLSAALWAKNPNYIIDVEVADWMSPDFNLPALDQYTTHFDLMFNPSLSDIGAWGDQLQNPLKMSAGYDFVDDPETPSGILPKLVADKQAGYGVFFWDARAANSSFYSSIEQAVGNLSTTTSASSTTVTTSATTSISTSSTSSTSTASTSTISGPEFSNNTNVIILYPSTLWGTPTNQNSIGTVAVGTIGQITKQPVFDSNTELWFYYIIFLNSQKGWVKQTQMEEYTGNATSTSTRSTSTQTTSTSSTTSTTATTTVSNGGGGGGGGGGGTPSGGGGGGSSKPVSTRISNGNINGYIVSNIAQLNTFNVSVGGKTVNITENFITPTSAGVTVDGSEDYILNVSQNYVIGSTSNSTTYMRLLNISYLPIEQTIGMYIYSNSSTSGNNIKSLNIKFSISNLSSVNVTPSFFANDVMVINVTKITPVSPGNYIKLAAISVDTNSSSINSISFVLGYPCGIPSNQITPFQLENLSWNTVNYFSANSTSCNLSFTTEKNITLGIMQFVPSKPVPTTIYTTTIYTQTGLTSKEQSRSAAANSLYLITGILVAAIVSSISYIYAKKMSVHIQNAHTVMSKSDAASSIGRRHLIAIYLMVLATFAIAGVYSYSLVKHYEPMLLVPPSNTTTTLNSTVSTINSTVPTTTLNSTSINTTTLNTTTLPTSSSTALTTTINSTINTTTRTASSSSITSPTTTILQSLQVQQFQEFDLPMGTKWYVQLGTNLTNEVTEAGIADQKSGYLNFSTGYINFSIPAGTYYYTVNEVPGYNLVGYPLRNEGYINTSQEEPIQGRAQGENIQGTFVQCASNCNASVQTVSFERFGPPLSTNWSVTVDGITQTSNSWFINFTEPLGAHYFQVNRVSGYNTYPSEGTINLSRGSSVYTVSVNFAT